MLTPTINMKIHKLANDISSLNRLAGRTPKAANPNPARKKSIIPRLTRKFASDLSVYGRCQLHIPNFSHLQKPAKRFGARNKAE